jgi:geranylgeranyl diphosphate synthase type II
MTIATYLRKASQDVDAALSRWLPRASARPATIHEAMRYSIFAGGKRLRPILCIAAAEACGGDRKPALRPACAVECIHTYSLIHDDLPCMDDDELRRGRPTAHKVFGEGLAVLAGDALLTVAFEILAGVESSRRYPVAEFIRLLAVASGSRYLIAGQVADLEGEGIRGTRSDLRFIHERKTAAVIEASLALGAMTANTPTAKRDALMVFGRRLGLAFQIIDDILDVTQPTEKLGKSAGKDIAADKTTYPSVLGLEGSRNEARRITVEAHRALDAFGSDADRLREIADYLLAREF